MALDNHPNVFRYEGKLWVSELPREQAHAQLVAQRAWDAATTRHQRWWVAIVIGAVVGVAAILGLGFALGAPPVIYLFVLPVGFGAGAVLGAVVNKRLLGDDLLPTSQRPTVVPLTKVPFLVARRTPPDAMVAEIIDASTRGLLR